MEDYFDREIELEQVFTRDGKQAALAAIKPPPANVYFVRQKAMLGTGHALLAAKAFAGNDAFVVAYPDDLFFGDASASKCLVDAYRQTGQNYLMVQNLGDVDVSRYGVVDVAETDEGRLCVRQIVEKPARGEEPSKLVSYGRYLFTADLFPILEAGWQEFCERQSAGEFYHIGAINQLAAAGKMNALEFPGLRLDTGQIEGYLESICRYALQRADTKSFAKQLFKELGSDPS